MDSTDQNFNWVFFWGILAFSYIAGLLWQALLHRVWGAKILKEISTGRALYFKTNVGEFRVDKVHKKFNYKPKKEKTWQSLDFDEISSMYIFFTNDTASLIEFFLGDWSLWDLAGDYRDVVNTYTIRLKLKNREEVDLIRLKQYEQREWLLGAFFLSITIGILKRVNLYKECDLIAEQKLTELSAKFHQMDLVV